MTSFNGCDKKQKIVNNQGAFRQKLSSIVELLISAAKILCVGFKSRINKANRGTEFWKMSWFSAKLFYLAYWLVRSNRYTGKRNSEDNLGFNNLGQLAIVEIFYRRRFEC